MEYLIAISIGPVQGFIAAARRTRDLWFGSKILSDVGKAAARGLKSAGAELIFPAPRSDADLEADPELNVSNKLLALVTGDPLQAAEGAKKEARDQWRRMARAALEHAGNGVVQTDIWERQVGDVLELNAAWVPLPDEASYSDARTRLEQLLGARKATREFEQSAKSFSDSGFGIRKSSLDAARESVLVDASCPQRGSVRPAQRRKLGLAAGEQLDCPGLVKRLCGGHPEEFPAVTRIALETWLRNVDENDTELKEFGRACGELLCGENLATKVTSPLFKKLPYDGGLLFPARIESEIRQLETEKRSEEDARSFEASLRSRMKNLGWQQISDGNPLVDLRTTLVRMRNRLYDRYGKPTSYFVVLVADGDNMGSFLDRQTAFLDREAAIARHRDTTARLAEFAARARKVVAKNRGACVYAGGDDVMALLPLHTAMDCAADLKREFQASVEQLAEEYLPTLSVGLGIGHVMTPYGRLLELGRRAERQAKEGGAGTLREKKRNALAIIASIRSGAELEIRGQWGEGIVERLTKWMDHFRKRTIPAKVPYDLREGLARFDWARRQQNGSKILAEEAARILKKKRAPGAKELGEEVRKDLHDAMLKLNDVDVLINELLMARWIAKETGD